MLLPAPLSREERGYVVDVIRRSIEREVAGSPDPGPPNASSASRNWRFAMKIAHCAVLSAIIVLTVLTGSYMTLATGIRTMRAGRADAVTVTNRGGIRTQARPRRSPRARMPCLASRRAWANSNGNSIDSQTHRIDSERNPSATANEPGFPVLRRGSNGHYLR